MNQHFDRIVGREENISLRIQESIQRNKMKGKKNERIYCLRR